MTEPHPAPPDTRANLRTLTHAVYALQALAFLTAITPLIGVVINYVKLDDTAGSIYQSHFRWQIRTFWWSLLWTVVGTLALFVLVGYLILFALTVWYIYRIVKGWLWLNDNRPMY